MTNLGGLSAYQQTGKAWESAASATERATEANKAQTQDKISEKESKSSKIETKPFTPISSTSSLIPKQTDYGYAIGDVKLSDTAADYYKSLKSKFAGMDFIVVSNDMKDTVKQNAAAYGNANKMVVLIDEEKLERMATDEDYRNKYEGLIAMAQSRLNEAKNSLVSSGASVKNFGISIDENGNEKFFATLEKSSELQKERIEKHAEEKKAQKAEDRKKADRQAHEEQIDKIREKSADPADSIESDDKEYVTIESNSLSDLISKVSAYSYQSAEARVRTEEERMIGTHVDFKG